MLGLGFKGLGFGFGGLREAWFKGFLFLGKCSKSVIQAISEV